MQNQETVYFVEAEFDELPHVTYFITYSNSVSLQNTVSCDNSSNSASTNYTVSWFCIMSLFYSYNILKLPKFPRYPKSTFPMYITSPNVHYISQCTIHLPMYITSPNVQYISQCTLHLPMYITSPNVQYISQCTLYLPMYNTSPNVHYTPTPN